MVPLTNTIRDSEYMFIRLDPARYLCVFMQCVYVCVLCAYMHACALLCVHLCFCIICVLEGNQDQAHIPVSYL